MTAPKARRHSVAVRRRLYSSGTARWALARAAARIGPDFRDARPGPPPSDPSRTVSDGRIRRLDHFVLTVADPEATVSFYERLGMERVEFDDGRLAVRFGDQKINLHQAGRPIQPHARLPTPGSADVCLLVQGTLDEVERELERAGVVFELGSVPRTGANGPLRSLSLRDPASHLGGGHAPPPPALPPRPGRQPGGAVRADLSDQRLEGAPPRLEVLELVEARARRREQDDVARPRRGARGVQRVLEVAALARIRAEDVAQRGRRLADQIDAGAAVCDRLAQRRKVLALAAAAEDQVDRRPGEALERDERRVDVR